MYEKKNRISDVYIINKAILYICVGKYVLLSRKIMGMEYNLWNFIFFFIKFVVVVDNEHKNYQISCQILYYYMDLDKVLW